MKLYNVPVILFMLATFACATTSGSDKTRKTDNSILIPGMTTQEVFGTLGKNPRKVGQVKYPDGILIEVFEHVDSTPEKTESFYLYFVDNKLEKVENDGRMWRQKAEEIYARWSF